MVILSNFNYELNLPNCLSAKYYIEYINYSEKLTHKLLAYLLELKLSMLSKKKLEIFYKGCINKIFVNNKHFVEEFINPSVKDVFKNSNSIPLCYLILTFKPCNKFTKSWSKTIYIKSITEFCHKLLAWHYAYPSFDTTGVKQFGHETLNNIIDELILLQYAITPIRNN